MGPLALALALPPAPLAFSPLCFLKPFPCPALRMQPLQRAPHGAVLPWAGPSPPPHPAAPRTEPAAGSSATLCLVLLGSLELQLLGPRGCSGLHGSTGLGSSGWFVKDILNGQGKALAGRGGRGEPRMGIGGAQPCPGAPGLQAEASLLEKGPREPQQGRRTEVRGCRV